MFISELPMIELLIVFGAYLFGSISTAIILCKMMNLDDPRTCGSNNPGATNMLRIAGKRAAALTFIGDVLKGVIPVLIAQYFDLNVLWMSAVVMAAFLGHCLPIFFSFHGGKGVATAFGAITTMNWHVGIVLLIVWALMFLIFRISSVAGISSALAVPLSTWILAPESFLPMTIMALLMIWRHQDNIKALIAGNESRL